MKKCFKCNKRKPLSEYYKHPRMADGHLNKCKCCTIADTYERRHNSEARENILEYDRARGNRQDESYLEDYRALNPNKYKAHKAVGNAIRGGILIKQPCEVCNKKRNLHAHYDDYKKPLKVRWLCAEHHRQWHAEHGESKNG